MIRDHSQNHYGQNASFDGYDSDLASAGILIESMRQQLAAQAAQIEMMREALGYRIDHPKVITALSTTPNQALEEFAAKVRNQCAVHIGTLKHLYMTQGRPAQEEAMIIAACDDALSAISAIKELP